MNIDIDRGFLLLEIRLRMYSLERSKSLCPGVYACTDWCLFPLHPILFIGLS